MFARALAVLKSMAARVGPRWPLASREPRPNQIPVLMLLLRSRSEVLIARARRAWQ
jgi:hypothetical protein